MPGVIHIRQDSLLLRHRPWHTMLRSSVTDHSMRKYCTGVYKHMPAGFEAHLSFFTAAPEAVSKLANKTARATRQALTAGSAGDSTTAIDHGEQLVVDTSFDTSVSASPTL